MFIFLLKRVFFINDLDGFPYKPSEIKNRFSVWWNTILWPRQKVKLCDSSCFTTFQIFQIETSNKIIVTPDVFRNQMHLVVLIYFAAFFGPVPVTHAESVLAETCQHHNDHTTLFPDHLPKVCTGVGQWSLSDDVSWISWIVIRLRQNIIQ